MNCPNLIPVSRPEPKCHRQPLRLALVATVTLAALSGCALGPDHARPTVATPAAWKEAPTATSVKSAPSEWWTLFADPVLNALEAQAAAGNQDLQRAVARVTEARALTRASRAELYPTLSAGSGYSWTHLSKNRDNSPRALEASDFSQSLDLGYELDVWGRVRRGVEAARADAAAVAADLQVVRLTLAADVARQYHSLRALDHERAIIEGTIALRQDALQLQQTRHQAGLINEVEVARARTELASVEAELEDVLRSRSVTEHALAILCGQPPASFAVAANPQQTAPPTIPAGLPSELLRRRPDILEAEHRLAADSARIGVAKAAFYPTIKLTGSAGRASADLGSLFDWPSRVAQFGPSISVPIFEGGRNRANLDGAEARHEQSAAAYRSTVLNAFREVEDALSSLRTLVRQREAIERALAAARQTASLAGERYARGLSSYLEVVDAQRAVLQTEREGSQLQGLHVSTTILLVKSLGGGW